MAEGRSTPRSAELAGIAGGVAGRQLGLVTVTQLDQMGIGLQRRRAAIARGQLIVVRRGVFRLNGAPASWLTGVLAAVLAAGTDAVASHLTAASVWRLVRPDDPRWAGGPVHVTSPQARRLAGVMAHERRLQHLEVSLCRTVPVTSAERTLIDLSSTMDSTELGRLTDEAIRRRIARLPRVWALTERAKASGHRRLSVIRTVLSDRLPGYDPGANDWERRMDRLWDGLGLPPAQRQYTIRTPGGTYRPDRAIVDLQIAVDWNGYGAHGDRSSFDYDSDRRADLSAAGWYPLDFTSNSKPERICNAVLAVVGERRRSRPR